MKLVIQVIHLLLVVTIELIDDSDAMQLRRLDWTATPTGQRSD